MNWTIPPFTREPRCSLQSGMFHTCGFTRRNVLQLCAGTALAFIPVTLYSKAQAASSGGPALSLGESTSQQVVPEGHKVVHFVRHGEGFHNIGVDVEDAALTSRGWVDAMALKAHIEALPEPLQLQVVLVSPLRRTLETACGAFGGGELDNGTPPLMLSQPYVFHAVTGHEGIAAVHHRPFVAVEECRERMSVFQCDRRSPIHVQKVHFPGVDFSLIEDDEDVLWGKRRAQSAGEEATQERYKIAAEKNAAVTERGLRFVKWVMQRPETHIAVVSHRELLYNTLGALSSNATSDLAKQMKKPFNNCELRSIEFDTRGTPVRMLEETQYPGGSARLWLFPLNVAKQQGRKLGRMLASQFVLRR